MQTILAITVGGSCQPIIAAIQTYQPDHVCFIASVGRSGSVAAVDATGTPCTDREGAHPSIVAQTGLTADRYNVLSLDDPDSLQKCYNQTLERELDRLSAGYPGARRIADYTGGTKSMSVALAWAAVDAGWSLSLVKGTRADLVQVAQGTEAPGLVNTDELQARRRMEEARALFNSFSYAGAEQVLSDVLGASALPEEIQGTIRRWVAYCRAFDAWDRFDHNRAAQILQHFQADAVPNWIFLKKLLGKQRGDGYERVADLLLNAERRAARGRFDDAAARLYRAIEMLAQVRLLQGPTPLNSGDLDVGALPAPLQPLYETRRDAADGKVRLALLDDYELLRRLDDPVGLVYEQVERRLRDALQLRNYSILAHGADPLGKEGYSKLHAIALAIFQPAGQRIQASILGPQFPALVGDTLVQRDAL